MICICLCLDCSQVSLEQPCWLTQQQSSSCRIRWAHVDGISLGHLALQTKSTLKPRYKPQGRQKPSGKANCTPLCCGLSSGMLRDLSVPKSFCRKAAVLQSSLLTASLHAVRYSLLLRTLIPAVAQLAGSQSPDTGLEGSSKWSILSFPSCAQNSMGCSRDFYHCSSVWIFHWMCHILFPFHVRDKPPVDRSSAGLGCLYGDGLHGLSYQLQSQSNKPAHPLNWDYRIQLCSRQEQT